MQKFLQKYKIDQYPREAMGQDADARKLSDQLTKMQVYVSQNFDEFVRSGSFTQKNLETFERALLGKLQDYAKKESMSIEIGPRIRGNANGATHVRSHSGKFKNSIRTDGQFEEIGMAQGRLSMKNQEKLTQLESDLMRGQRSRGGNAANDKQMVSNLSLPQIVASRGGTIPRADSKLNKIHSEIKNFKPSRHIADTAKARGAPDAFRLQNFRSSAQIQQDKSYFIDENQGYRSTVNQQGPGASIRNSMQLVRKEARDEVRKITSLNARKEINAT